MIIDIENVMCYTENTSFYTTFHQQEQKEQEIIDTLHDALKSEEEDFPTIPEYGKTPAADSLSQIANHPQLPTQIRDIALEKARCIYALEIGKSFLEAAKDA